MTVFKALAILDAAVLECKKRDIIPPGIRCRELRDLICDVCREDIFKHLTRQGLESLAQLEDADRLCVCRRSKN